MNEKCDQHNYDQLDKELNHLVQVIARLRAKDGGCPWDREQTHASRKSACVEEAAEVIGGINILESTGNAENLKEELGDSCCCRWLCMRKILQRKKAYLHWKM